MTRPYQSRSALPPCPGCGRRVVIRFDGDRARHRTGAMGIDGPWCVAGRQGGDR